jgi:hypothetical protein
MVEITTQKNGLNKVGKSEFVKAVYELLKKYEENAPVAPEESKSILDIVSTFYKAFDGLRRDETPRGGYDQVIDKIYEAAKVVASQPKRGLASHEIEERLVSLENENSLVNIYLAFINSDLESIRHKKLNALLRERENEMVDLQKKMALSTLMRRKKDSARRAAMQS